jgi:uncharacterized protein YfaA (DUF2138 family)
VRATSKDKHEEVIKDATEALRIDAAYVKALMRRAQAYEATSKLAEALKGDASPCSCHSPALSLPLALHSLITHDHASDYDAALALDGSLKQAREAKERLPAAITEQQQREQEKMLGTPSPLSRHQHRHGAASRDPTRGLTNNACCRPTEGPG